MDVFCQIVWRLACERAKKSNVPTHPFEVIARILCTSEKTVQRRFKRGEDDFLFTEVKKLQKEFKSDDLDDYLVATIKNAFNS